MIFLIFFPTINRLTVREYSDKDEAIVRSAEQLSQHKVRNPDQTKRLFCFSLTVRTIERLGSMQTQHLFLGAVFLIKVLSILLSFFLFDIRGGGGAFIFLWNLVILHSALTALAFVLVFFLCHSLFLCLIYRGDRSVSESCCVNGCVSYVCFWKTSYTLKSKGLRGGWGGGGI